MAIVTGYGSVANDEESAMKKGLVRSGSRREKQGDAL